MRVYKEDGTNVTLNDSHFISQGGQGSVYGRDGIAYKIYTDINHAIPESKIDELNKITNKDVIKPEFALFNVKDNCIGYAMRQINSNLSLCQLFNHSYKTKHNISNTTILHLLTDMQEKVSHIHKKGILIVDFNEMNFLVDENDYSKSYFIDVDSYQTQSHSAGAIAEHIRDRHTKGFNKDSDWFSFSIIAFRLLMGLHPYKGRHKVYKQLNDRMLANMSAFNKEVKLPAICPPFDTIPDPLRNWLENVLENGKRTSPPLMTASTVVAPQYTFDKISGLGNFKVTVVREFKDSIRNYFKTEKHSIFTTNFNTYVDNYELDDSYVCIHEDKGNLFLAKSDKGKLELYDFNNVKFIENDIKFDNIFNINNKLCYKNGGSIYKIKVNPIGSGFVTSHLMCNVMQNATQIFDNTLIQNILGNYFVSIFDNQEGHYSVKVPELNGYKLTEAKYENKVLIVKGSKTISEMDGTTVLVSDKFVIVFHRHLDKYSIRKIKDVSDENVNMSVIETKNIACHIRKDSIELFSNDINSCNQIKEVNEDDLSSFIASRSSNFLTAINGKKIVNITMT